ncbi:hypothetical protein P4O66_021273 [Electrophorus voltai]|uniref:Uncharacterized protein n=1 Tax=Electrophorus voltai TaxID=2609070 RepID=A0AAD8ZNS0_9TELE|nr:hypothetical protein P4O66_021273 [Electrophorus voltai]
MIAPTGVPAGSRKRTRAGVSTPGDVGPVAKEKKATPIEEVAPCDPLAVSTPRRVVRSKVSYLGTISETTETTEMTETAETEGTTNVEEDTGDVDAGLRGLVSLGDDPSSSHRRRMPYSDRPAGGGPPTTREAAGVGDQELTRLQDWPEMATAGAGTAPRSTAQAAEAPAETPTAGRASPAESGMRAGSGLLNTARFRWRDPQDGTGFTEQVPFIREVLFGGFGLNPRALICAQRNGAQKYYDVTFASDAVYRRVLELGDGMGGHPLGKDCILEPLWDGDRRMVTIHFFNPHVSAAEVRRFLSMYGEVLPSERMVRDELGIWNGRRQFMRFSRNSEGQERTPSSSAGEEDQTEGSGPGPKGAPPAPPGKAKRKRERALKEQDKRMKAGSPLMAAPVEESPKPTDPSLIVKLGGPDENTLSPPLHYGGREGSPNETPYIEDIGDRVEGGDSSVLDS